MSCLSERQGFKVRLPILSPRVVIPVYFIILLVIKISGKGDISSPVDEVLTLLLIPACISAMSSRFALKTWSFFLVYALISMFGAMLSKLKGVPQPFSALYDIALDAKFAIIFFGLRYLVRKSPFPVRDFNWICGFLVAVALLNSLFVVFDFFSGGIGIYGQGLVPRLGFFQPQGLFRHHVTSCWIVFFGTLCAYYLYREVRRWPVLAVAVLLMIVTLLHISTKEIIALIVVVGLYLVRGGRRRWLIPNALGALALAVVILFFTPVKSLIDQQFSAYLSDGSSDTTVRTALTVKSFSIANDFFPIGSGGGTYASLPSFQYGYSEVYQKYGISDIWGATSDNPVYLLDVFWPKILAQAGWLGGLFFLLYFFSMFKWSFWSYLKFRDNRSWLFLAVAFSSLMFSVAGAPFSSDSTIVVIAYFAACANLSCQRVLE